MINGLFYLLINKLNKVDLRLMCFCVIWREIIEFGGLGGGGGGTIF